jgi:hypothetical protein
MACARRDWQHFIFLLSRGVVDMKSECWAVCIVCLFLGFEGGWAWMGFIIPGNIDYLVHFDLTVAA